MGPSVGWHETCFASVTDSIDGSYSPMDENEVIAVLVAGYDDEGVEHATVILRDLHGNVSMKLLDARDDLVRGAARHSCFRRGKPIVDPVSQQLMGYELEEIGPHH